MFPSELDRLKGSYNVEPKNVVFILGSSASGTSQLASYFISMGFQPPIDSDPEYWSGEGYWLCGLTSTIDVRLTQEGITDPEFNFRLTRMEEESIYRFYHYNPDISVMKCPLMHRTYGAWARWVQDPKPIIVFRNPLKRARVKEDWANSVTLRQWAYENSFHLRLNAPAVEFGAVDYTEQLKRALAVQELPCDEDVIGRIYAPDRIHERAWNTDPELLPADVRKVYDQLVERSRG